MKRKYLGVYEAKTHLSTLVREAAAGAEVVITNGGKPMAKIIGYVAPSSPRKPGLLAGRILIKPGFDELPPGFEEFVG